MRLSSKVVFWKILSAVKNPRWNRNILELMYHFKGSFSYLFYHLNKKNLNFNQINSVLHYSQLTSSKWLQVFYWCHPQTMCILSTKYIITFREQILKVKRKIFSKKILQSITKAITNFFSKFVWKLLKWLPSFLLPYFRSSPNIVFEDQ